MSKEDASAVEELLDKLKPKKDKWPTGAPRDCYLGALAAVEALGIEWTQLETGQHVILRQT